MASRDISLRKAVKFIHIQHWLLSGLQDMQFV